MKRPRETFAVIVTDALMRIMNSQERMTNDAMGVAKQMIAAGRMLEFHTKKIEAAARATVWDRLEYQQQIDEINRAAQDYEF